MVTGFGVGRRRLVVPSFAVAAACVVAPIGVAQAVPTTPVFDVDAYTQCTSTTVPAPDQDADAVVSACCAQFAGVPAPTRFGMGCAAPMRADAGPDERPLIVLPSRELPDEQADADLNGLIDMPVPEPLP
ncbi:hypothetical protein CIW49_17745 [Mycolicibacterium sp. P1-18]|uniref:hypothetical protein n=1 Tax=Mycolicibacterium sp. P1-18 TaxID=2024615 RepID=UPI0011F28557|nr:hypothetical protein [Mycolicibacterium sp. P1-18]KAA0097685.1 hypothetical protein CIW49_17745 [Mycolicibacterium sp. P1-18]